MIVANVEKKLHVITAHKMSYYSRCRRTATVANKGMCGRKVEMVAKLECVSDEIELEPKSLHVEGMERKVS